MPALLDNVQSQIIAQMQFIRDTLLTLVQSDAIQGDCVMVSNMRDMWEQASQDTETPLVYVCYGGESEWSSNNNLSAVTYRVKRNWIIGIKQGRGHDENRGETLIHFLPFVEQVRDTLRAMLGISQDIGNDFHDIQPWSQGTQVIDGYMIRFSTQNDLPPILPQPDE